MKFTVITLFPQMIEAFVQNGLIGQAHERGQIRVESVNPRQFTTDAHHTVDDRVYGGGDGMVMKVEPLAAAVQASGEGKVIVMSPQGRPFSQARAQQLADAGEPLILVCGRYAGIDHRFIQAHQAEEISIGDYILNGGEIAACAVIEAVARLRPEVLGNQVSAQRDSFSRGLLECPQFTRPREVAGLKVPAELLSGHHENVRKFEHAVSVARTAHLRPDLLPPNTDLKKELKLLAAVAEEELLSLGLSRKILSALESK